LLVVSPVAPQNTSPTTIPAGLERPEAKRVMTGYFNGNKGVVKLNHYARVAPIMGVKDVFDRTDLGGTYTTNPSNTCLWHVTIIPVNGSTPAVFTGTVTITYYVKLVGANYLRTS